MTLPQAKRLNARQAGRVSARGFDLIAKQKRINPKLVREILLNATNEYLIGKVLGYVIEKAQKGEASAVNSLSKLVSEGFNPNSKIRGMVLAGMRFMTRANDLRTLPVLLIALNDSVTENRLEALRRFIELAEKGEDKAMFGFVKGINDPVFENHLLALRGIQILSEQNNPDAIRFLKLYKRRKGGRL